MVGVKSLKCGEISLSEIETKIIESFENGIPLDITSPKVDGERFYLYKDAWKELLREVQDSGDEERLHALLNYGASSGVSKAYGRPEA